MPLTTLMKMIFKTAKVAADKIAFLGLFVIALLIAHLIISSKSAVLMSEPIVLKHTNLSVTVPAGNGWQREKAWRPRKNSYLLSSVFAPGPGGPAALVLCKYQIDLSPTTPNSLFEQKAFAIGGEVAATGQIGTDELMIEWAHLKNVKNQMEMLFGTAQLPYQRQLNIEVHVGSVDFELGQQVFKKVCESIKFEENQLLKAGDEIISEIKSAGLSSLLQDIELENFFLIKDSGNQIIGFTMEVPGNVDEGSAFNIQVVSYYYIREKYPSEQVSLFQSVDNLEKFYWKSEISGPPGMKSFEIVQDPLQTFTIKSFDREIKEEKYQFTSAVIPEVLLDMVFHRMVRSGYKQIMVDVIKSDGNITAAVISEVQQQNAIEGTVLELELLNERGFAEQIYLDNKLEIHKQILLGEGITLERTNKETVIKNFPERLEYILQKNKLLEQNQL